MGSPVKTWQRQPGAVQPSWIDFDLDEQDIPLGHWLVWPEEASHIMLLTPEQFEEAYR